MTNPPVVITRHPDHLLVEGTWIARGNPNKHEPWDVPWSLTVPTLRHLDHLAHVLLHPGVEPMFDPGELEMNGVEDARNLMHLNWWDGSRDELCELDATAGVSLDQQPWTGTVTLCGVLKDGERLGLARLTLVEAIDVAARLEDADASGLPDGDWVVGRPWFPDPEQIRVQAEALKLKWESTGNLPDDDDSSAVPVEPCYDPWMVADTPSSRM